MIVSPDKGVFFVVTALMCSAALYAAEISSPNQDLLRCVFVGEPNKLTVPPGFPGEVEVSLDEGSCAPPISGRSLKGAELQDTSNPATECARQDKASPGAIIIPGSLKDVITEGTERAAPVSLSTAVQAH